MKNSKGAGIGYGRMKKKNRELELTIQELRKEVEMLKKDLSAYKYFYHNDIKAPEA